MCAKRKKSNQERKKNRYKGDTKQIINVDDAHRPCLKW